MTLRRQPERFGTSGRILAGRTGKAFFVAMTLLPVCASHASAGQVQITDLGIFGGTTGILTEDTSSIATGISANGIVAGSAWGNGHVEGFVYSGGAIHNVGALGVINNTGALGRLHPTGVYTYGRSVNSFGYVTGSASQNDQFRAYESVGGTITPVAVLPTGTDIGSGGTAINERGSVAGWTGTAVNHDPVQEGYDPTAFLYYAGTLVHITAAPAQYTFANGLNNNDLVVGDYGYSPDDSHGFAFNPYSGMMTDLGTLGGLTSIATAVNDAGQIVGYSADSAGVTHAFVDSGNQMVAIGGSGTSEAYGISQDGHVVGAQDSGAFVYYGGIMTDLNALLPSGSGWQLSAAYGVNDAGQIVGEGLVGGNFHAFLLDNVFLPGQPASQSSSGSGYSIGNTFSGAHFGGFPSGDPVGSGAPVDAGTAPEPGTWLLLLGGSAAVAVWTRLRAMR